MRIVFFTSAFEFGEKSLESLIKQNENVIAVVMPPDDSGKSQVLKNLAADNGIPVYEWKSIKNPEVLELLKTWKPDFGVSAGNKKYVFTRPVIDTFSKGIINYHCSKLPKNGGQFPINWQIYKGEPEIGITIHYCDEGIDTGELMLQDTVPLGPDDTFKSIYFGKVLQRSVDMLSEAVRLMREGKAPRIKQDHADSTYNHPFGLKEATLDWSASASQIYNAIRASDGWPGARTTFRGETLKIWQAKKRDGSVTGVVPGTIVAVGENGIEVGAPGGVILLERVQLGDGPKLMAKDFLKQGVIKVGDKLGE